jgi:threonine/homoserine/homoserine lactone efflux protein
MLAAFVAASVVLAVTPGPGVVYIVARSLGLGRRSGLASVAGVALGNACNALGAAVGLAVLLAVSALAFTVVKWAGAAYLIYLGIATLRGSATHDPTSVRDPVPARRIFRDGFLVALLNPKTAVFFAAFLPQFMTVQADAAVQGVVLGSIFVAIAAVTDTMYALLASSAASILWRSPALRRRGRIVSGSVLIGLGIYTATAGQQSASARALPR